MKKLILTTVLLFSFLGKSFADGHRPEVYGPYPITLKGYDGDKTNSVKYTGQMARQVLHDSLKALVKTGDLDKMMSYYNGEDGLEIISKLIKEIENKKLTNLMLCLEIDSTKSNKTLDLFSNWKEVKLYQDLAERDRYVFATR